MTVDIAANLAFFLLDKAGSTCGHWAGKMTAMEQRTTFGRYIGRGRIVIDGATETVKRYVSVCFGQDVDCVDSLTWRELEAR